MNGYELTEKERFTRQAEWDKFSEDQGSYMQTTFARELAKSAFIAAFDAGLKYERARWEESKPEIET